MVRARRRLVYASVATALIGLAVGCKGQQPGADTQMPGSRLYAVNCSTCHGPSGQGIGDFPKITGTPKILGGDYDRTVIAEGRNKMPSFGALLTPEQINQIVDYVATFKP